MSRDALDDFAKRLFDAAREEPLPKAALERAVAAAAKARAEQPPVTFLAKHRAAVALLVAVAAAVTLALWPSKTPERLTVTAEPTTPAPLKPPPAPSAKPQPEPEKAGSARPTPLNAPSAAPLPRTTPSASASTGAVKATLGDELDALKRAETALGSGDAKGALDALNHYDGVLHGQQLRAEAALLRMDALTRSGHAEQAAALAARFVAENPGSPLVDRARSYLAKPGTAAPTSGTEKPASSAEKPASEAP